MAEIEIRKRIGARPASEPRFSNGLRKMDKGKLKGHAALWVANIVWGLNAPIGKSVLWS